jgi:hypothetical protein
MYRYKNSLPKPLSVTVFRMLLLLLVGNTVEAASAYDSLRLADSWQRAVERIEAGRLHDGFYLLDSLRRNTDVLRDSLLFDYARLVSRWLLPDTIDRAVDSVITVTNGDAAFSGIFLGGDEEIPEGRCWSVISTGNPARGMPCFSYDRQYSVREGLKLWLPPLAPYRHADIAGLLSYETVRKIPSGPLIYNPGEQPWKVHLKIVVDCTDRPESLLDFVVNLVARKYDFITEKKVTYLKNAISLRCYNHQVFHSRPGAFYGIVAFDRPGGYGAAAALTSPTRTPDSLQVRYLIAVKANRAIEDKAELILANVLARFRGL